MIHRAKVSWHRAKVTRKHREKQNGHKSVILWFTGLSSSGKSTLAHALEERLYHLGCRTFVFDGDNVRHGLCSDLEFSLAERAENIRRIGEMVKLTIEAGVMALTAFISPMVADRQKVRALVNEDDFIEIYCRCPIEICEQRDPKGLYKMARAGKVKEFTGISSPYEPPKNPELVLDTGDTPLEECVEKILILLLKKRIIKQNS